MDMFRIQGGRPLNGLVRLDGSKNASLPAMAAGLAMPGGLILRNVPGLRDVETMSQLLTSMHVEVQQPRAGEVHIVAGRHTNGLAAYDLVRQMRASVCVLGPLLGRFGQATVSLPGGCNIGHRPIDLHLQGLAALGADIRLSGGYVTARARRLRGAEIDLGGPFGPTVTGTCNLMMAAVLAHGSTRILNAAREPEIEDLAALLTKAGGRISGAGTSVIEIEGVDSLSASVVEHTVMPDRIEAGTFVIAGLMAGGTLQIPEAPLQSLTTFLELLQQMGADISCEDGVLQVRGGRRLRSVTFTARPYPGIPTDLQAQLMALLAVSEGTSEVTDAVFPDRFMHAAELVRLGADIRVFGNTARVQGVRELNGAPVMACDLRASAALVLAALAANGETELRRVYHLDRGYQGFDVKLSRLGAIVERIPDSAEPSGRLIPPPHFEVDRKSPQPAAVANPEKSANSTKSTP